MRVRRQRVYFPSVLEIQFDSNILLSDLSRQENVASQASSVSVLSGDVGWGPRLPRAISFLKG